MRQLDIKGVVKFRIRRQDPYPKFMQDALRDQMRNGVGASNSLRFQCRIAQDANETFERIEIGGDRYVLNPKAKAQFGRNAHGEAYLTVGVIRESDGTRLRFQWEGDAVPLALKETAVRHDEGKAVKARTVALHLGKANIWKVGEKAGRKRVDPRPQHDRDAAGKRYPRPERRSHARYCHSDLQRDMAP